MDYEIKIAKLESDSVNRYEVVVEEGSGRSRHVVDVPAEYVSKLGVDNNDNLAVENLLHRSFVFLLKREPKESILKQFALNQIEDYFSEYPIAIKR